MDNYSDLAKVNDAFPSFVVNISSVKEVRVGEGTHELISHNIPVDEIERFRKIVGSHVAPNRFFTIDGFPTHNLFDISQRELVSLREIEITRQCCARILQIPSDELVPFTDLSHCIRYGRGEDGKFCNHAISEIINHTTFAITDIGARQLISHCCTDEKKEQWLQGVQLNNKWRSQLSDSSSGVIAYRFA